MSVATLARLKSLYPGGHETFYEFLYSRVQRRIEFLAAVTTLIATHNDRDATRAIFDQVWGQIQAGAQFSLLSEDERASARAYVAKLFSTTP